MTGQGQGQWKGRNHSPVHIFWTRGHRDLKLVPKSSTYPGLQKLYKVFWPPINTFFRFPGVKYIHTKKHSQRSKSLSGGVHGYNNGHNDPVLIKNHTETNKCPPSAWWQDGGQISKVKIKVTWKVKITHWTISLEPVVIEHWDLCQNHVHIWAT